MQISSLQRRAIGLISATAILSISGGLLYGVAEAASSWNPALLVNTESFQTIDEGDGTTNVEIRFGQTLNEKLYYDRTNGQFVFTNSLKVGGNITATGSVTAKKGFSGSSLQIDNNAYVNGNLSATGSIKATGNITTKGTLSGASLIVNGTANISGNTNVKGSLSASGAIWTSNNGLTINSNNNSTDDTLTFGNTTAAQTIKYLNTAQKFKFSKDVSVNGNLSGSTLTVDGDMTIRGITYHMPTTGPTAGQVLKANDNSNNLVWSNVTVGSGSGGVMSMHPEYPNSTYFSSGTTLVGQLVESYDTTNKQNYYHWTSTKAALNDYWVAIRVKVPKNFSSWDSAKGLELYYRTHTTSSADNYVYMRVYDTAGALVSTSGNGPLVSGTNDTWATANITGLSGGTWTAGGYMTINIKVAAKSTGTTDLGYLNFNWTTTTP